MDGDEGEAHPKWGARVMGVLFDAPLVRLRARLLAWTWRVRLISRETAFRWEMDVAVGPSRWHDFALYHSRFYSKAHGTQPSRLCMADKLAVALEPWWLYLPRVIATGEIREYMSLARDKGSKYGSERRGKRDFATRREWAERMQAYCRDWALEHADGRTDTWTPDVRRARDDSGVWE